MLKNYLVVAIRSLQRHAVFSFINVAGLSVALACSMLIFLWVGDEVSYDGFHEKKDRLYQVYINQEINGVVETMYNAPYPLMDALLTRSGNIKHVSIINHGEGYLLAFGANKVTKIGMMASEDFLDMFTFPTVSGNVRAALSEPTSFIINRSTAKALFGNEDPLNKIVKVDNRRELKVAAVIEDVPGTSTLQFDFLLPESYYASTQEWFREAKTNWKNHSFRVFVELQDKSSLDEVSKSIASLERDHSTAAPTANVFLFPLERWHLYNEFSNGQPSGGMITYVRLFTAIAVFILIIACINFMNLATARSESRAREVGIRKVVGSRQKQLVLQFLGESMVITVIAFLFSIVIVELSLPFFNMMVGKSLQIHFGNPYVWIACVAIIVLTGLVSGSYPAFFLSRFKPVNVLKGKVHAGSVSVTPRKILVISQFAFSIFLIVGTLVIYQQIIHVKSRQVGYDRENLMLIWTTSEREQNFEALRQQLVNSGIAKAVTKSSAPITRIFSTSDDISWQGKTGDGKISFVTMATEYDFTETMGIKMLEGRDFSRSFPSDSSAVIINKAALNLMGISDPIGQKINMWGDDRTIIGVTEDVLMGSPYGMVDPTAMVLIPGWSSTISVRLNPTRDLSQAVAKVEKIFKTFDPETPLWSRFADEEFDTKFKSIDLVGNLAAVFCGLAVLISCLGLFGLAAFMAEQRTKEVGIRKILGASVSNIVVLMTRDFSKLIIFAFLLAAPVAWYALDAYLQQYPYRVSVQWWVVIFSGGAALLLTMLIVSSQALRAARSNPANSLRSE